MRQRPDVPYRVFVGFDPREAEAVNVAITSLRSHTRAVLDIDRLALYQLRHQGLYRRPTTVMPNGQLFDELSDAPMSTEHAITRFYVPLLCRFEGWALFVDGDVLFRDDVVRLFDLGDPRYAVQVVQHPPLLTEGVKKDGQIQQAYPRKNWSSVILWNCAHPAHDALTVEVLNAWPGRDLHAFRWLADDLIGDLPAAWNYLVGVSPALASPSLVHYTLGTPNLADHAQDPFAKEWLAVARHAWPMPIGATL